MTTTMIMIWGAAKMTTNVHLCSAHSFPRSLRRLTAQEVKRWGGGGGGGGADTVVRDRPATTVLN